MRILYWSEFTFLSKIPQTTKKKIIYMNSAPGRLGRAWVLSFVRRFVQVVGGACLKWQWPEDTVSTSRNTGFFRAAESVLTFRTERRELQCRRWVTSGHDLELETKFCWFYHLQGRSYLSYWFHTLLFRLVKMTACMALVHSLCLVFSLSRDC